MKTLIEIYKDLQPGEKFGIFIIYPALAVLIVNIVLWLLRLFSNLLQSL